MKLIINFAGICTHFRQGVAAGVPHRVVLPDATNFVTGLLTVVDAPVMNQREVYYYLMPHYAQLELDGGPEIHVPSLNDSGGPVVRDGDILAPIRLQVVNAVDQELEYAGDSTRSLTEFVADYTFSSDVVLNGRAACYFDLYGGRVVSHGVRGGASQTRVELTTDGFPELLVTPLASSSGPVRSHRLQLRSDTATEEVTLAVKNLELAGAERKLDEQGGAFDYLFHYLTARGGIPQTIQRLAPGMERKNLVSTTQNELARTFAGMAAALRGEKRALVSRYESTPACGDSRYP